MRPLTVVFRGNFRATHSTESHVAASMEDIGLTVVRCQEDEVNWDEQAALCRDADLFWWTQTKSFADKWSHEDAMYGLRVIKRYGPAVGFHLDIWWGLPRSEQVRTEPFFRVDRLFSTDGGHDAEWADAGVNHRWMPPGVYAGECEPGVPRPNLYPGEVAFVGNWRGYHPEHPGRQEMIQVLRQRYGRRFRCYPDPGQPAIRGEALRDLYATIPVLVGDSCFGGRVRAYCSDRVPESLGRGGYLVHPFVEGLMPEHFTPGEHLATFPPGDWRAMCDAIDRALADPEERGRVTRAAKAHVLEQHTYAVRVRQILDTLAAEGLLRVEATA